MRGFDRASVGHEGGVGQVRHLVALAQFKEGTVGTRAFVTRALKCGDGVSATVLGEREVTGGPIAGVRVLAEYLRGIGLVLSDVSSRDGRLTHNRVGDGEAGIGTINHGDAGERVALQRQVQSLEAQGRVAKEQGLVTCDERGSLNRLSGEISPFGDRGCFAEVLFRASDAAAKSIQVRAPKRDSGLEAEVEFLRLG